MPVRLPPPLAPGDRVGVTAPSAGVPDRLRPRLAFAQEWLADRALDPVLGDCLDGSGPVSASAEDRATEMMDMLLDPAIRAVVPPWGGELAVEVLPLLDFEAIASAPPTWVVGFSDLSTILVALTTRAGLATVHAANLMDTPYMQPPELAHWFDVCSSTPGTVIAQSASRRHRSERAGYDRWEDSEELARIGTYTLDAAGRPRPLNPATRSVTARGVLIGGCIETVSTLAGTPFGAVASFADAHAPDGLIVYLEASEDGPFNIARNLWRLRLAGWFDRANAILFGRSHAPDYEVFTQRDAIMSALHGLNVPVLLDVDIGHVPPQMTLVNGVNANVSWTTDAFTIRQMLAP